MTILTSVMSHADYQLFDDMIMDCCRPPDIAAVGIYFKVFSFDELWGRDSNQSPSRQRTNAILVIQQSRV